MTSSESRRGGRATVLLAAAATVAAIGLAAITLVNRQRADDKIDTGTVPIGTRQNERRAGIRSG